MHELARRFRLQLEKRQFKDMESTWLELLELDLPLADMNSLADRLEKQEGRDRLIPLLSLLADRERDKGRRLEQLEVLRRLARLTPDDANLAREASRCLHDLHPGLELLERLLHKTSLGYGTRLDRALEAFDLHVSLLPGTQVYDPDRGSGTVESLDLLLDRVTVSWQSGTESSYDIGAAGKRLTVSSAAGFFTRLARSPAGLTELCHNDAGEAVALYLRDIGHPASIKDIQTAFAPLVTSQQWPGFWDRARKGMSRNPHIAVATRPARNYRWQDEVATPETQTAREGSEVRRAAPDESKVAQMKLEALIQEYEQAPTATARRQFLERIKAARPDDWDRVYAALFRIGKDNRGRAVLEKELSAERPELWQAVLEQALTGYRQSPEAFIWLLENSDRFQVTGAKGYLSRALDLLSSINHRPFWIGLRKQVAAGAYRVVNTALEQLDADEAGRVLERVHHCRGFEEFRKAEVMDLFVARFPDLAEPSADEIWGTAAGIEHGHAELRELTDRGLPAVAEEIARARSHGDLSENYEYKAAKEKQARLMTRINRLRDELGRSRVLSADRVDLTKVSPGCRVRVRDGRGTEHVYVILGPWESDPEHGVISHQSPLARQLLGARPGGTVQTDTGPLAVLDISLGLPG